jgi:hypothetical protein
MRRLFSVLLAGLVVSPAAAAPVLDGTQDASYGAPVAVQTVQTGFGDNFSELDAAFAQVSGGKLYLMLTGNIEANQNRLEIFVDSKAGGQNKLVNDANTPTNDSWAPAYAGFTFDAGFTADYMFILRRSGASFNVDLATIGGGPSAYEAVTNIFGGSSTGANPNALPIAGVGVAYDNSNTLGVGGNAPNAAVAGSALTATTGLELAIPLSAIGNPSSSIKISAMVNSNDPHTYLSNQFLGGLAAPQGNLGGDGTGAFNGTVGQINLNNFAGNQFFTVQVPEPTSMVLVGWALVGLVCCMWRRSRVS